MVNYFIFEWYITDKSQIKHCFSSLVSWHDSCFVRLLSHKVIVPLHPSPPSLWLYLSAGLLCLHLPRSFLQLSLLYDFIVSWCLFQSELLFFHIYSIRAVVIWFLLRTFCILLGHKNMFAIAWNYWISITKTLSSISWLTNWLQSQNEI